MPLGDPLIQISGTRNQEGAHREGYSAESEKVIDVGYPDENAGERPILGGGEKGGTDKPGVVLFLDVTSNGIVRGGEGEIHSIYCLRRGDLAFFRNNAQLGECRRQKADKVEVRFRGSKGDQGRKGPS